MPDPRFFEDLGPVTLGELATLTGAELADRALSQRSVRAVAVLDHAQADTVTFITDRKYLAQARDTQAAACFVRAAEADGLPATCAALVTEQPQAAYAAAAERLHRPRRSGPGPAISPDVKLESDVQLGPGVVVGAGAQIGRGTRIGANSVIGPRRDHRAELRDLVERDPRLRPDRRPGADFGRLRDRRGGVWRNDRAQGPDRHSATRAGDPAGRRVDRRQRLRRSRRLR